MYRKIVAALCLGALLAAGCSPDAAVPAAPGEPVTLVALHWPLFSRSALEEAADAFAAAHPEVRVRVKDLDLQQLLSGDGQLAAAALADADVVLLSYRLYLRAARAGQLRELPVTISIPELHPELAGLFDPISLVRGQRYGMPVEIVPLTLLLHPDRFAAAGVPLPPADWTLAELEQTLAALHPHGLAALPASAVADAVVRGHGGQILDPETGAPTLDTPEARQGLAWLARLTRQGLLTADPEAQPAMEQSALWPPIQGGTAGWARQPLPRGPAGRHTPVTAVMAAVLADSTQPELAQAFAAELVKGEEARLALARAGIHPLVNRPEALAAWREAVGEQNALAFELSLDGAYPLPEQPLGPIIDSLAPYFRGEAALDDLLHQLTP